MEANPFDKAARYAAKRLDPEGFLDWLLPGVLAHWRWDGWLPARSDPLPGEPVGESDAVAAFGRRDGGHPPVALVVEFQARPQGDILERVLDYLLQVRRGRPAQRDPLVRYAAVGVVVNLTGPDQESEWGMAPPDFGGLGLHLRAGVRSLRQEDGPALLGAIAAGRVARALLPWLPLMRGGERPELVAGWRRLAEGEADARKRGDYGGLALVFAELAGRREVWEAGLEGYNMEVSQVVLEWQAQALARGRAEGRAEGQVEGQRQASRDKLLRVLRVRFGPALPAEVADAVARQTDPAALDRWFDLALTAATLDEVRAALLPADGAQG